MASSQGLAAFSPAARTSGGCFCMKVSSGMSPTPPALATRCHLMAAAGSPGFGGGGERLGALLGIDGADAPAKIEHGEGEYCLAIAAVGGEPVPLGRLLVVALDAQAVGIELGEQCHGLDVLVLVHPLGGDRKRRDVGASLERAVGQ